MPLATTKTSIGSSIEQFTWLLYGPPKIGKSTFASETKNPYFLTTEHGHRHLSIYNRQIEDWLDFRKAVQELRSVQAREFNPFVIDTVPLLYSMCQKWKCEQRGIDHPSDEEYGKGYDFVREEFSEWINKLVALNKGVIFITHHKEEEVKGRGIMYTKFSPKMPAVASSVITPLVDVIAYCGFKGDNGRERALITEPREDLEAGFRTPRGRKVPIPGVLPLSYAAVKSAWEKGASNVEVSKPAKKHIIIKRGV